ANTTSPYFGASITSVRNSSDVPLFFDSTWVDGEVQNGAPGSPVSSPLDLTGSTTGSASSPANDHWRFLIARHGRAINVCMADGSARRVGLEDTYQLIWHKGWVKYSLKLPVK